MGQGWEGGLAGLATDYGVSIDAEDVEPGNNATGDEEFDVIETPTAIEAASDPTVVESDLTRSVDFRSFRG